MNKIKNIAIIAFDSKKTDLIEWSYFNKNLLLSHQILALGFAGNIVEGTLNKKIEKYEAGKLGGYRYLCNLINDDKIDAVIIFGEAEEIFETKDLNAVLEASIRKNIVVAANKTTADFIIHSSLIDEAYAVSSNEKKEVFTSSDSFRLAKAS